MRVTSNIIEVSRNHRCKSYCAKRRRDSITFSSKFSPLSTSNISSILFDPMNDYFAQNNFSLLPFYIHKTQLKILCPEKIHAWPDGLEPTPSEVFWLLKRRHVFPFYSIRAVQVRPVYVTVLLSQPCIISISVLIP